MTSRTQITPLRRDDIPELSQFLISGFGVPATSSLFSPEVLSWKYFDGPSGPSGDSVCRLIARSAGRIIGHIGICPRQLIASGGRTPPVPQTVELRSAPAFTEEGDRTQAIRLKNSPQ